MPRLIAPAGLLACKPPGASWEAAAAFPVPAIIAEQVLGDALSIRAGERSLSTEPAESPAACWPPSPCCAVLRSSRRQVP